jgi:hypothetical protein
LCFSPDGKTLALARYGLYVFRHEKRQGDPRSQAQCKGLCACYVSQLGPKVLCEFGLQQLVQLGIMFGQ